MIKVTFTISEESLEAMTAPESIMKANGMEVMDLLTAGIVRSMFNAHPEPLEVKLDKYLTTSTSSEDDHFKTLAKGSRHLIALIAAFKTLELDAKKEAEQQAQVTPPSVGSQTTYGSNEGSGFLYNAE